MASLNQCNFIGNLGRDPEVRHSTSGTAIANFSLAVTEKYNGEEKTEWVNVVLFGKLAENAGAYLSKGKAVFISGRMQIRKWQDKDGNDRYSTEIVGEKVQFLSPRDRAERDEAPIYLEPSSDYDPDTDLPF